MSWRKRSAITRDCNKGWAIKFQHEAEMAAKRILEHPLAWQFERDPFRRFLLNRFPYKMLYVIENNRILVIAVSHQHRQPDYRIERNNRA